jgi:hypothetical protein
VLLPWLVDIILTKKARPTRHGAKPTADTTDTWRQEARSELELHVHSPGATPVLGQQMQPLWPALCPCALCCAGLHCVVLMTCMRNCTPSPQCACCECSPADSAASTGATPYRASPSTVSSMLALLGRAGYLRFEHSSRHRRHTPRRNGRSRK